MRCQDALRGLSYEFVYGAARAPLQVVLRGAQNAVHQATGVYSQEVTLNISADQVDSIRMLSLPDSRPVKFVGYDSFGNVVLDTRPGWQFPLGFACGLNDPWTGFVRFGFRDYDPRFGRFTTKDPACDLRGDGDLWDYCVDDPVGRFDPYGLAWATGTQSGHKEMMDIKGVAEYLEGQRVPLEIKTPTPLDNAAGFLGRAASSAARTIFLEQMKFWGVDQTAAERQQSREKIRRVMHPNLEAWGQGMLEGYLPVVNARTRGASGAIMKQGKQQKDTPHKK